MKMPSLLRFAAASVLVTACLALPSSLHAEDNQPKTPLAEQMSGMSRDFRSLRKIVNDPAQKDAALKLAKDMEEHATKAKGFDPSSAKGVPPAEKDQFLADYRKQIDGLIADIQKLQSDVSAGNMADASATLDKIGMDRRQGHKKFNTDSGPGSKQPAAAVASPSPAAQ